MSLLAPPLVSVLRLPGGAAEELVTSSVRSSVPFVRVKEPVDRFGSFVKVATLEHFGKRSPEAETAS